MNALKEALLARAPEFAADFEARVRRTYEAVKVEHGPTFRKVGSCFRWARTYTNTVRPFVKEVPLSKEDYEAGRQFCIDREKVLDEDKLKAGAEKYGRDAVLAWYGKIMAKTDGIENPEIAYLGGTSYVIWGTRGGRKISIEQSMILNHSSRGTLFNQFPARIYVDGKFLSEAKFKALWAVEAA